MEMNGSARSRIGRIACLFAFAALLWPGAGWGTSRVALVVGNGGYDGTRKIHGFDNPVNDAELMAKTLERVGFQVTLVTDADQAKMKASIKEFGKRLITGRPGFGGIVLLRRSRCRGQGPELPDSYRRGH